MTDLLTTPFNVRTAREYIRYFRTIMAPRQIDYVDTDQPRRIWLDHMTDEDALFVAFQFAQMETKAAQLRKLRDN